MNSHYLATVEDGLKNADFIITTETWLKAYEYRVKEARKAFAEEIRARAKAKHTMAVMEGMGTFIPDLTTAWSPAEFMK